MGGANTVSYMHNVSSYNVDQVVTTMWLPCNNLVGIVHSDDITVIAFVSENHHYTCTCTYVHVLYSSKEILISYTNIVKVKGLIGMLYHDHTLALSKTSLIFSSVSPDTPLTTAVAGSCSKGHPSSPAMAWARRFLPQPGGPYRSIPVTGVSPKWWKPWG